MSSPPGRLDEDARWMERALALARRGEGRTSPNPMVGAVVVRGGVAVAEGWHRRCGAAHAEVEALARAGRRARGATLYVTLEPCNHHGRTPPCVDAVVAAGIERVVAALGDPNRAVRGGGLRALRRHGIAAELGPGSEVARRQNESFLHHATTGRPLVLWKCAASLDGRIALASGASRWVTEAPARAHGHRLRRWADAVMVGSETVAQDDPKLTLRDGRLSKPLLRVVLDGRLRISPRSALVRARGGAVLVFTRRDAPVARARALERAGVTVLPVARGRSGRLDLDAVLEALGGRGVGRLLVEGGGEVTASLLRAGRIDRFALYLAPRLLGGDARAAVAALALRRLDRAPRLELESVRRVGPDLCLQGRIRQGGAGLSAP